jgi:hypothetical protein
MNETFQRKRGAPRGNQNARKHGFYSRVLDSTEKRDLKQAGNVAGLDQEIDLLRVKLKSVLEHDPANVHLMSEAAVSLARLLRTREHLIKNDRNSFRKAIGNVLREVGLPLGLDKIDKNQPPPAGDLFPE